MPESQTNVALPRRTRNRQPRTTLLSSPQLSPSEDTSDEAFSPAVQTIRLRRRHPPSIVGATAAGPSVDGLHHLQEIAHCLPDGPLPSLSVDAGTAVPLSSQPSGTSLLMVMKEAWSLLSRAEECLQRQHQQRSALQEELAALQQDHQWLQRSPTRVGAVHHLLAAQYGSSNSSSGATPATSSQSSVRPRHSRDTDAYRTEVAGVTSSMAIHQPSFWQPTADPASVHALLCPTSSAPIRTTGSLAYERLCQQEAAHALRLLAQFQSEEKLLAIEIRDLRRQCEELRHRNQQTISARLLAFNAVGGPGNSAQRSRNPRNAFSGRAGRPCRPTKVAGAPEAAFGCLCHNHAVLDPDISPPEACLSDGPGLMASLEEDNSHGAGRIPQSSSTSPIQIDPLHLKAFAIFDGACSFPQRFAAHITHRPFRLSSSSEGPYKRHEALERQTGQIPDRPTAAPAHCFVVFDGACSFAPHFVPDSHFQLRRSAPPFAPLRPRFAIFDGACTFPTCFVDDRTLQHRHQTSSPQAEGRCPPVGRHDFPIFDGATSFAPHFTLELPRSPRFPPQPPNPIPEKEDLQTPEAAKPHNSKPEVNAINTKAGSIRPHFVIFDGATSFPSQFARERPDEMLEWLSTVAQLSPITSPTMASHPASASTLAGVPHGRLQGAMAWHRGRPGLPS